MRIARILAVGCLLLGLAGPAWGQARTADDAAIEKLYNDFFEALRQAGAQGAVGYLRQSGTISESNLRQLEREAQAVLERNPMVGRPDSWVVVNTTEVAGAPRYRAVYAVTHHEGRPLAWRLRFYQRVTGVWVFTDVEWEAKYVEDFLRLPEIQFDAYRKLLEEKKE
jgi:hypothetical protein